VGQISACALAAGAGAGDHAVLTGARVTSGENRAVM
jgi:hypothetical protein